LTLKGVLRVAVGIDVTCGSVIKWQSVVAAADGGLHVAERRGRDQERTLRTPGRVGKRR
jgi:hypothetical protein